MSSPSSSRPPLLGLLNPNSRHYHAPGGRASTSVRLGPVSSSTSPAHHSTSSDDDDDGPPRSFLLDATPRQSVLLSRDGPAPSTRAGGRPTQVADVLEPFINPSSKGSSSSSSSSSGDDSSSSNSEITRSPPPPPPTQPMSLPLPVTTPAPSSSSPAAPPRAGLASTSDLKGKGREKDPSASSHRRRKHKSSSSTKSAGGIRKKGGLDEYEKALWDWVNVDDLDTFLQDVSHIVGF